MTHTITSELIEAYSLCPRKAFLYMTGEPNQGPHEYVRLIEEQAAVNKQTCRTNYEVASELPTAGAADLKVGAKVVADAVLEVDELYTRCDFLMKVSETSLLGRFSYEPVKVIGTRHPSRIDVLDWHIRVSYSVKCSEGFRPQASCSYLTTASSKLS